MHIKHLHKCQHTSVQPKEPYYCYYCYYYYCTSSILLGAEARVVNKTGQVAHIHGAKEQEQQWPEIHQWHGDER